MRPDLPSSFLPMVAQLNVPVRDLVANPSTPPIPIIAPLSSPPRKTLREVPHLLPGQLRQWRSGIPALTAKTRRQGDKPEKKYRSSSYFALV